MADTSKKWTRRVAAWRASGLSSTEFCAGRGFTAGGLRHWAHRLRKQEASGGQAPVPPVRLARVVRATVAPTPKAPPPAEARSESPSGGPPPALVLEAQGVRIGVPPGFDPRTLALVLDVLDQRRAPGGTP